MTLTSDVRGSNAGGGGDGDALGEVAAEALAQVRDDAVEQEGLACGAVVWCTGSCAVVSTRDQDIRDTNMMTISMRSDMMRLSRKVLPAVHRIIDS